MTETGPLSKKHYSLWLMPEKNLAEALRANIRKLACRCDTPVFHPHATLLGQVHAASDSATQKATHLAERLSCFFLEAQKISHSDAYFRCLVIELALKQALSLAHKQACELFSMPGRAYRPHISLLYGHVAEAQRQQLAAQLSAPAGPLKMDALALVNMGENNRPSSWQIYKKYFFHDA